MLSLKNDHRVTSAAHHCKAELSLSPAKTHLYTCVYVQEATLGFRNTYNLKLILDKAHQMTPSLCVSLKRKKKCLRKTLCTRIPERHTVYYFKDFENPVIKRL